MNYINKSYKPYQINHKAIVAKKKFKYKKKKPLIVKYLVADLNLFLSDFVPQSVSEKVSLEAEQAFNFFFNINIEDVFLFLTERENNWEAIFKVFPKYLTNKENFVKIEKYLNKSVIIFDLKTFYLKAIKKYNI
jgi:hypothetical protein